MTAKDWKIVALEGALKNGPWFCLYFILTSCLGYGFIEFGRIAGGSVKSYIEQAKEDNETTLAAVLANQQLLQAMSTESARSSAEAIDTAAAAKVAASNANESARLAATATAEVAARLLEAKQEMSAVSKRRDMEAEERIKSIDAQTGVLGKLLSVQESVLETLRETQSKNSETPPMPNDGGA